MQPRVAVLAFAAPLLITAPALADHDHRADRGTTLSVSVGTANGGLTLSTGTRGNLIVASHDRRYDGYGRRGYRLNAYGQTQREVRQLRRQATRACRRAIVREASWIGFHDVDFDDGRHARQIGPNGFRVTFHEVEFEGRRRDIEVPVTCTVRRGDVRYIEGIPQRGHRGRAVGHRRGNDRGWQNRY